MSKQTEIKDLPLVLKVEDLMSLFSIGRNSAYELVRSGELRSFRVGRSYRISRDALEEYLRNPLEPAQKESD